MGGLFRDVSFGGFSLLVRLVLSLFDVYVYKRKYRVVFEIVSLAALAGAVILMVYYSSHLSMLLHGRPILASILVDYTSLLLVCCYSGVSWC